MSDSQKIRSKPTIRETSTDSGWCWIVALSCCFINMMVFGLYRVSGQLFVETLETFPVSREIASFPYTLCPALRNILGPFVGYLGCKLSVRSVSIAGALLSSIGVGICFIATDITWIIIFWGVVFGLGFALANHLLPVCINDNFVKHRATASGISFGGSCLGSFILPPIIDILMAKYGLHGTFLVLSGLTLNCIPAAMLLRRPKVRRHSNVNKMKEPQIGVATITQDVIAEMREIQRNGACFKSNKREISFSHCDKSVPHKVFNSEVNIQLPKIVSDNSRGISNEGFDESELHSMSVLDTAIKGFIKNDSDDDRVTDRVRNQRNHATTKYNGQEIVKSKESETKTKSDFSKFFILSKNPMFVFIVVSISLYEFSFLLANTIILDSARDMGIEESKLSYVLMCLSAGDFVGRLGLGWTTDVGYLSKPTFVALTFLLQGAAVVSIPFTANFWQLMVAVLTYGAFEGGLLIISPLVIAHYIESDLQSVAVPASYFLFGPLSLAASPTIGYFRENIGSYQGVFYSVGLICLLGFLTWFCVSIYDRRKCHEMKIYRDELCDSFRKADRTEFFSVTSL